MAITRTAFLLASTFGLTACLHLGSGGGGGGGAGGGIGLGGGTPIAGDGKIVTSTVSGHGRVMKQNFVVNPSDLTNPTITYGIQDQTRSGGQMVKISSSEVGGKVQGNLELASATDTLENGTGSLANISGVYSNTLSASSGAVSNNYLSTPMAIGESASSLSVVDFAYARAGIGIRLDPTATRIVEWAFFGGKADNTARPGNPSASATYTGEAGARVLTRERIMAAQGDLMLTANVNGAGVVDGMINNIVLTLTDGSQQAFAGSMLLENGTMAGADFNGTIRVVDATGAALINTSGTGRGTFQGGLYGPNGEEVAGGFDVIGTGTDPVSGSFGRVDIYGAFVGMN